MVATQQQQPDLGFNNFACFIDLVRRQHQGFDGAGQRQAQLIGHGLAGAVAGGGDFFQRLAGRWAGAGGGQALGFFDVGGVIAVRAVHDGIFTGGSNHLKLFAQVPANGTTVGPHGTVLQAKTVKNALVSIAHGLVAGLGAVAVFVEGVGILHGEFAPAHQAKPGAALIAEFGLNLVEILGQLLVAFELLAGDVGDHFFAGRLNHKIAPVAILKAQQLRPHFVKAPRLLPCLCRLHYGHGHFNCSGAIHLLAHDGFDFADHAQAHGHVAVHASTELFNHPRTGHELVADDLSVGRRFLQGRD